MAVSYSLHKLMNPKIKKVRTMEVGGHYDFILWIIRKPQINITVLFQTSLRLKKIYNLHSVQHS
jgi:hypothetical protein